MKGSEKQIIWATELKNEVINGINGFLTAAKAANAPTTVTDMWESRLSKVIACEDAAAIIDFFQGYATTGDVMKDSVNLNSKYNLGTNHGYSFK